MCDKHYNSCDNSIKLQYNTIYCRKNDPSLSRGLRCEVQLQEEREKQMKDGIILEQEAKEDYLKKWQKEKL